MSTTRHSVAEDLQGSRPAASISLTGAGVTRSAKAIRIRHNREERLFHADITCFCDLGPDQKGVHMSRFEETVNEAIDEVVIGEAFRIEVLAEHIAQRIVERQQALRSEVTIRASYPVEKRTPVTDIATQEMYGLIGVAVADRVASRRIVGVTAQGMNACPCAQGLIAAQARRNCARTVQRGRDRPDRRLVPIATHNQRARGTLYVGTPATGHRRGRADRDRGGRDVVGDLRADEAPGRAVRGRPRPPPPALRGGLGAGDGPRRLERFPDLPADAFVHAHQANFETIHTHDVEAQRSGLVGEIRAEMDGGARTSATDPARVARRRRARRGPPSPGRRRMNEIVVTAVGADRPGIVAAITGALLELGGNLEETRAALLRGSFATVLAVAVPDGVGARGGAGRATPRRAGAGPGPVGGDAAPRTGAAPLPRAVVSVYGADHPGIVHAMATALAGAGANIVDLSSRLVGDPPIYVLGIEVELPPGGDAGALRQALAPVAAQSGVELAIESEDDEVL